MKNKIMQLERKRTSKKEERLERNVLGDLNRRDVRSPLMDRRETGFARQNATENIDFGTGSFLREAEREEGGKQTRKKSNAKAERKEKRVRRVTSRENDKVVMSDEESQVREDVRREEPVENGESVASQKAVQANENPTTETEGQGIPVAEESVKSAEVDIVHRESRDQTEKEADIVHRESRDQTENEADTVHRETKEYINYCIEVLGQYTLVAAKQEELFEQTEALQQTTDQLGVRVEQTHQRLSEFLEKKSEELEKLTVLENALPVMQERMAQVSGGMGKLGDSLERLEKQVQVLQQQFSDPEKWQHRLGHIEKQLAALQKEIRVTEVDTAVRGLLSAIEHVQQQMNLLTEWSVDSKVSMKDKAEHDLEKMKKFLEEKGLLGERRKLREWLDIFTDLPELPIILQAEAHNEDFFYIICRETIAEDSVRVCTYDRGRNKGEVLYRYDHFDPTRAFSRAYVGEYAVRALTDFYGR